MFYEKRYKMTSTHGHRPQNYNRAFAIGISLNVAFVAAEIAFGLIGDSMALLADAGHNLSDVLGLLLAWAAAYLSRLQPTRKRTYGWRSSTIMAALLNAVILLMAVGGIAWESVRRLTRPEPVAGATVVAVAALGVVVNTATALLFAAGRKKDLNIRGAFLHMAADAGVSGGVVLAGTGILLTDWLWIDPAVSLIIAGVILIGTWGLFRESMNLALQAVPASIDINAISDYLAGLPGVKTVHDLHVWAMSTTETALTAHLVKPDPTGDDSVLARARDELHARFGIAHTTIQLEKSDRFLNCGTSCVLETPWPDRSGGEES
jgi:cobalt-zinc-cadmium efflux system protein